MAQMVKNPPVMRETWVRSLGQEDPLEKGMATHSSILAWRLPWTEEPGGLQSMGSQRVRHNSAPIGFNWGACTSVAQSYPIFCDPMDLDVSEIYWVSLQERIKGKGGEKSFRLCCGSDPWERREGGKQRWEGGGLCRKSLRL